MTWHTKRPCSELQPKTSFTHLCWKNFSWSSRCLVCSSEGKAERETVSGYDHSYCHQPFFITAVHIQWQNCILSPTMYSIFAGIKCCSLALSLKQWRVEYSIYYWRHTPLCEENTRRVRSSWVAEVYVNLWRVSWANHWKILESIIWK